MRGIAPPPSDADSLQSAAPRSAWVVYLSAALLALSCKNSDPPPSPKVTLSDPVATTPPVVSRPAGPLDAGPPPAPPHDARPPQLLPFEAPAPHSDWAGPHFVITFSSAGIYSKPVLERSLKIGYARSGGRLPVLPEKVEGHGCRSGWYEVVGGGFVCSKYGTTNTGSRQARLTTKAPDLTGALPYLYARNAKNGTPLYRSVPSAEQMKAYEPYLQGDLPSPDAGLPWWQQENAKSPVQLEHLEAEGDGVLERRMVKGFYVAVDQQFEWSGRSWYKTTKGKVGPKDRFWEVKSSEFEGIQLSDEIALPLAWVYGYRKSRSQYVWNEASKKMKTDGLQKRLVAVPMTGEFRTVSGRKYAQTVEGHWLRSAHIRMGVLPPIPEDIAPKERWIDVNLDTQTLVAFVGRRPVYATLVSSGKESEKKDKDHRTPIGQWNIREKHITTTMDGDGSAAGDLPYSIEDVPYAMYFHGSYALHGAFWHRNYGSRMSHGCVNLAPLDARYLFFFTGPHPGAGWHGAWSNSDFPGSRIVVRDPTP